jgi:FeS assembly SUF system regulator
MATFNGNRQMLRISKLTDYAIIVLTDIADQDAAYVSAKAIVGRTGIHLATVKKVLRQLMQGGLVLSIQGVSGGYALVTTSDSINIATVIKVMEGDLAITECSTTRASCTKIADCKVSENWQYINTVILRALESITINKMQCSHTSWQPVIFEALEKHSMSKQ